MGDKEKETVSKENGENQIRPVQAKYRYLLDMGYRVTVNDDETMAQVDIPGPSFETFDLDGNYKIWSLMRMMGAARYMAYHYPLDDTGHTFIDYGAMTDGIYTFMASSQFEIEKEMYDSHVPKWPLQVKSELGHIGKSSTSSLSSLIVPSTGQVLLRNITQVVGIDKTTRKPTPLPTWWREKYANHAVRKEPLLFKKLTKPDNANVVSRKVTWSETDRYGHANWTSYVIFCIDALHHGIKSGNFEKIDKKDVKNGLKLMGMTYFGECFEEEELSVYYWECEDKPLTVCFDVHKEGTTVFQNTISYHES